MSTARLYVLEGRLDDEAPSAAGEPIAWVPQEAAAVQYGVAMLKVPAGSVAVLEVVRK